MKTIKVDGLIKFVSKNGYVILDNNDIFHGQEVFPAKSQIKDDFYEITIKQWEARLKQMALDEANAKEEAENDGQTDTT